MTMTRRTALTTLAGAFVPPRNPLTDPRPWDVVEKKGIQLHVHMVKAGQIYMGRFRSNQEPLNTVRCDLSVWRGQCVGATVIQRAEEVDV